MGNWLSRLMGRDEEPAEPVLEQELEQSAQSDPEQTLRILHTLDVDQLYYRWLIGQQGRTPLPESVLDKKILQAMQMLADSEGGGSNLVPRVPAVIPQLLRSLRDEEMSAHELARQIAHDVVLVAEVIHEANSPFYRPAKPIASLESAIMLLGQNGLRLLVARVAFRPIINMQAGRFAKQAAPHIWAQAELCADACSILGPAQGADPFESFLSGLMQNVGLIVTFRMIDRAYQGQFLPDSDEFCLQFMQKVRLISSRIAKSWEFPASVEQVIAHLGQLDHPVMQAALGRVLQQADQISKLRLLIDHGQLEEDEPFARMGLPAPALHCLDQLKRRKEMAA
ncbi:HDOD domain-containing protein [Massilia sp. W12]|uniref:HDOD domain-containing protein n=1 Tax=Massilia sp. W12 TaxID=3126507 RepID=UPI0030CDDE10